MVTKVIARRILKVIIVSEGRARRSKASQNAQGRKFTAEYKRREWKECKPAGNYF